MTVPDEAVHRAGCLECDWRYYAFGLARAQNWADAHSEEEGHGVKVTTLKGGKDDQPNL